MYNSDAQKKSDRHFRLMQLFYQPGQRLRTIDIAHRLGVSEDTAKRDIDELESNHRLPLRKDGQYWMLMEDHRLDDLRVRLNIPEAASLFLAGRLLSMMQDEQNQFTIMALSKLLEAFPEAMRGHQNALIEMAQQRQQKQRDLSAIFEALTCGWVQRRVLRLRYNPPPYKKAFETRFAPYLLEPSAIGRTIYALGRSSIVQNLRTYKLERIEYAELTDETFEVPSDFNGPELLTKAWGVMYGDEQPVTVHLRFTKHVERRVRETLWHPSQTISINGQGCDWIAEIGDTLEMQPWIRGWGSDCEVIAPLELREAILRDVRRQVRKYQLNAPEKPSATSPDSHLLSTFFQDKKKS